MPLPDLAKILSGLRWAVAGAVATRRYMPERATFDVDIVLPIAQGSEARRRLEGAGFQYLGELSIGGSSWRSPDGVGLDVIEGRESWWELAVAEASRNRDDQGLPVLTLPYLVLMKLLAGRVQDVADVSRMLGRASDEDLERVREVIATHAHDLLEDVESLIALGRLEWEESGSDRTEPAS